MPKSLPLAVLLFLVYATLTTAFAGLKTKESERIRVDSLNQRAKALVATHPEMALAYANHAIYLAAQLNYPVGQVNGLNLQGRCHTALGAPRKALPAHTEALALARQHKLPAETADAYFFISGVYYQWGEYQKALHYVFQALPLYETLNDQQPLSQALNQAGLTYDSLGELEKALTYFQRALDLNRELGWEAGMATAYTNIGLVHSNRQQYDKALDYQLKSLTINRRLNNETGIAACLNNIGDIHFYQQEPGKALAQYEQSLNTAVRLGDRMGQAVNHNGIARVHFAAGSYDLARDHYQEAILAADRITARTPLETAHQGLAHTYARLKDYAAAYQQQQLYSAVKDSIYKYQNLQQIARLEAEYGIQNKEQELALMKQENRIQAITLSRNRQGLWSLGGVLLLLLVLGGVLYNRSNLRQRANRTLSVQNEKIGLQYEELQKKNDQLATSESELSRLNATKDRFFSIISHDLRGPLNSLTGMLGILINYVDGFTPEELKEFARSVDKSVHNLLNLLENLLQWSRSQTNAIEYRPDKVELARLVTETTDLMEMIARGKQITLQTEIPADLAVFADPHMLRFVLRNLVFNALKFTNAEGQICIRATSGNGRAELAINDDGIGMSEADLEKLFRPDAFHSTSGTANEIGTGLGLLLCKDFVEKNGGTIWVESQLRQGTTFYFTLPLLPPQPLSKALLTEQSGVIS